jgi:hypothetical protein
MGRYCCRIARKRQRSIEGYRIANDSSPDRGCQAADIHLVGAPESESCHSGQFSENCHARCIRQVKIVRSKHHDLSTGDSSRDRWEARLCKHGTVRRECLDYVIPLSEKHLRKTLREWVTHYNQGRPHSALGPGIPADTNERLGQRTPNSLRHELPRDSPITTREILGGLHHEYELERIAA